MDVLSEIVTKEFVALLKVPDRLPSLPENLLANATVRTPTAFGAGEAAPDKSVEGLLAEFEVLRSAVIRLVEDTGSCGLKFDAQYAYVDGKEQLIAEACNHPNWLSLAFRIQLIRAA